VDGERKHLLNVCPKTQVIKDCVGIGGYVRNREEVTLSQNSFANRTLEKHRKGPTIAYLLR
jgi:hypothetical protein